LQCQDAASGGDWVMLSSTLWTLCRQARSSSRDRISGTFLRTGTLARAVRRIPLWLRAEPSEGAKQPVNSMTIYSAPGRWPGDGVEPSATAGGLVAPPKWGIGRFWDPRPPRYPRTPPEALREKSYSKRIS